MPIELPELPYDLSALEPAVSARTLEHHHGKHHRAYVDKTNALIEGTPLDAEPLPVIVRKARSSGDQSLFDNSAQAWNHDFLWQSMTPGGGGTPPARLAALIDRSFGGLERFAESFKEEATGHFGSGWVWLCQHGDRLRLLVTHDADTPLVDEELNPLLTLDLWEHAYYLDYQSERPDYITAFLDHSANWTFADTKLR